MSAGDHLDEDGAPPTDAPDDTPVTGVEIDGDDTIVGSLDDTPSTAVEIDADLPLVDDPDQRDDPALPWERLDWIACGVLLLVSVLLVGLHVRAYTTLSPIDELQHVDYTLKAGELDIVRRAELVGFDAMAEAACRSVDSPQYQGPPCGLDEYDPADFQEAGVNTAASQLPPYYVVTGLVGRAITGVGLLDSPVSAARMVGALWLAAALAVTWYVMSLLGVPRLPRAAVSLLMMVTPLVLFHAATVNADAVLMFTGSLVLLGAVQFDRDRLGFWWLLAIVIAVFFVEQTNLLAVLAVGIYLGLRTFERRDRAPFGRFLPLVILPVAALFRLEIVDRVQDALFPRGPRTRQAPMFRNRADVEVTFDKVIDQLSATFTPVQRAYLPPLLRTSIVLAFIFVTNWLLIGLMFSSAFGGVVRRRMQWWSRILVAVLLAAGPFYTFYYAYFSNVDYPAPGRFALPLVPLIMVVAAAAVRTRSALWVTGSVAVLSAITTTYHLLTP